jgi:MFS family permease
MSSILALRVLAYVLSPLAPSLTARLYSHSERFSWVTLFFLMLEGTSTIAPLLGNLVGTLIHWRHPGCHHDWGHDFHRRGGAVVSDRAEEDEAEEEAEKEG